VRLRARLSAVPDGYRLSIGRVLAIYSGLMLVIGLSALDQTIVAAALPTMVSDLGGLSGYSWVFTAYILGSTITIPIYGKLGDAHGRRKVLVASISIFMVGSLLCGVAQSMEQLAAARAVQGIGAGGIMPLTFAVIGRIVPPRDRGRFHGLISGMYTLASIAGPIVGGVIVDHASWRWIFLINLPFGAFAIAIVAVTLGARPTGNAPAIDWSGAALIAAGTSAVLLGLTWSGETSWGSPRVLIALTIGGGLLAALAVVERRAAERILPFELFKDASLASSVLGMAVGGAAMFGTLTYAPLLIQEVLGRSPTEAGFILTGLLAGAGLSAIASGQIVSRTGHYKRIATAGLVILVVSLVLVATLTEQSSNISIVLHLAAVGVGLGLMMPVLLLSVQMAVPFHQMGAGTALAHFARALGGVVGVAFMGTIVAARLSPPSIAAPGAPTTSVSTSELADSLQLGFLTLAAACLVTLLVVMIELVEVPLSRRIEGSQADAPPIS
jgi:EmrB/QacA subfamily drug resistance transporter